MRKTLGLDLGSNSLGWAVLDDVTGDILKKGVVVFPEGIDAANDTLETPAAIRRGARMGRRMKFRRKMRKWCLLKVLIDNKMCPMTECELAEWKKSGKYPNENKAFVEWLRSTDVTNPYMDRANAASKKVDAFVLGRALYHICQRRGFKSSRKEKVDTGDEKADEKENLKRQGKVAGDIAALNAEIAASGCKTLGQYFAKCIEDGKGKAEKRRIRARYTGRNEHYEIEFAEIMKAQGIKPDDGLYGALHKAIFLQRPLRSQKHLVGMCPLEPKSPRCRISHPAYEEFRMRSFVNNLWFENESGEKVELTKDEKELACTAFYKASATIKFGDIVKLFKKRLADGGLKFHYYRNEESLSSCSMRHRLAKTFGEVLFDEQKVFDALCFYNDDDKLREWFVRHYPNLEDTQVQSLVKINPKEGNAKYSLKAIKKMLPFLRKGLPLFDARNLAKITDILPHATEDNLDVIALHFQELRLKNRKLRDEFVEGHALKSTPPLLVDMFHDYLRDEWNVDEKAWEKYLLYYNGDSAYSPETYYLKGGKKVKLGKVRLPAVELGMIRNPLVQRSMTVLRRLVNYLNDHDIIDCNDTIRIELARGVNDYATRRAIQVWQKARQGERDAARVELGSNVTEDAIDRYMLWREQGKRCLYTGRSIDLVDVLSGNNIDIEHTIPRSRSGDDSMANKTLCDATYNRTVKKGMIPTECPNWDKHIPGNENIISVAIADWQKKEEELTKNYLRQSRAAKMVSDPEAKSKAKIKALVIKFELDYWHCKIRRFTITADKLEDANEGLSGFKRRQLVDTGIMCSHAVEFLKSVYPRTYAVNGAATAFARKAWGIQVDEVKDRTNHTHHAKDAMVIAALTPGRFNAICAALKDEGGGGRIRECDVCPLPYDGFTEKVRVACDEILVKHVVRQTTLRQSSKRNCLAKAHREGGRPDGRIIKHVLSKGDTVRGQLHKDKFYGCIANPESGKKEFVVRKSLIGTLDNAIGLAGKIVDSAVRTTVQNRLDELKASGAKNIGQGDIKMPSGVPINKVRVFAHTTNPLRLRDHAMASSKEYKTPYYVTVAEGSNFRLALFKVGDRYSVEPDNSLLWAQNHKHVDYIPLDQKNGFIGYIIPGSMAVTYESSPEELKKLSARELRNRLYKVVKFESTGRITFRLHTESRAAVDLEKDLVALGKHKAGESEIDFVRPHELLRLSPVGYCQHMFFENIHFKMMLDGSIRFL